MVGDYFQEGHMLEALEESKQALVLEDLEESRKNLRHVYKRPLTNIKYFGKAINLVNTYILTYKKNIRFFLLEVICKVQYTS